MSNEVKFKKLGDSGDYFNAEHDLLISKNEEFGNWDLYQANEWACDAKTKRELVAHCQTAAQWGKNDEHRKIHKEVLGRVWRIVLYVF